MSDLEPIESHVAIVPIDLGEGLAPFKFDGCEHEDLHFNLHVSRVIPSEGKNPHTFELEIQCFCKGCNEKMRFRGAKHAITFREPSGDIFGDKLFAPMEPSGDFLDTGGDGEAG